LPPKPLGRPPNHAPYLAPPKQAFTDTAKLNKHMIVHETEKRWKCPLCSKVGAFARPSLCCWASVTLSHDCPSYSPLIRPQPFVGEPYLKSHWKKSHKDVPMPAFVEGASGGADG